MCSREFYTDIIEHMNMSTEWYHYVKFGVRWSSEEQSDIHRVMLGVPIQYTAGQALIHLKDHFCEPKTLLYQGNHVVHGSAYIIMSASYKHYSAMIFYDIEKQYWFSIQNKDIV